MATDTLIHIDGAETVLRANPTVSFDFKGGQFGAYCYEPDDCIRGKFCSGRAATLPEAIEQMVAKVDAAKLAGKAIRTASECKAAVVALIEQHDAAPAAFRDAVDALIVSDR